MYCPNCGTKNNDLAVFCMNCVAKLPTRPPQPRTAAKPVVPEPEKPAGTTIDQSPATTVDQPAAAAVAEAAPVAVLTPPVEEAAGSSPLAPVEVTLDLPDRSRRLWAIPVFGMLTKVIMLIPHILALVGLTLVVALLQFILWVPVLITGRYPGWAYSIVGGTLRWNARVASYVFGLTDRYPPFGPTASEADGYPVRVSFERQPRYKRVRAVPLAGLLLRIIMVLPQLIVLIGVGLLIALLQLVLWLPVLRRGRYPDGPRRLVGGFIRRQTRLAAYLLGLTDWRPPLRTTAVAGEIS